MYNAKSIDEFIDKVNKEAEKAAEKVYKKYQSEYEKRVLSQLKSGDRVCAGMGMVSITSAKGEYVGEKLSQVLTNNEYPIKLSTSLYTHDWIKP